MSRIQRLLTLELLPLCYDREIKDLVFFFKALYGYINLVINDYVSFVDHIMAVLDSVRYLVLSSKHVPLCTTTTFKSSYFNRIVKPWNIVCEKVNPETFSSPISSV
jgi:hypothetical protein